MNSWLPVRYQPDDRPAYVIALVNWLEHEAMGYEYLEKYPILCEIAGWRSRECYDAVRAYDWTARMYENMNGPGAVV